MSVRLSPNGWKKRGKRMGRITLEQAAQWCGGRIDPKYKDVTFLGANNDTRQLAIPWLLHSSTD